MVCSLSASAELSRFGGRLSSQSRYSSCSRSKVVVAAASVPAVEQDAGLVARVAQDVAGAAGRGAGLAVRLSSSGQRRCGVWTCGTPIVNPRVKPGDDSHVSQDDPRGTRQWTRNIASTLLYSGVWSRPDHDAAMRIDVGLQPTGLTRGEVPGRRAHSLRRRGSHACLGSPPPRIVINARRS